MQPKQPALMVCLAAPKDAAWLIQWERHLLPLQQAGHFLLWSERLILGGEDRLRQMSQQHDSAWIRLLAKKRDSPREASLSGEASSELLHPILLSEK